MKNNSPIIIRGLPVSKGIAIGQCRVLEHGQNIIEKQQIEKRCGKSSRYFFLLVEIRLSRGFECKKFTKTI